MSNQFKVRDEVRVRLDCEPRLGIMPGSVGRVTKVTQNGAVVHVYIYPWHNTYVYGASELEHRRNSS